MKKLIIPSIALAAMISFSCSNPGPLTAKFPGQIVKSITVQDAKAMIDAEKNGKNFMIVDVRTPLEFSFSHIDGAVNIDYLGFGSFNQKVKDLDVGKKYLVYCKSGHRSVPATNKLIDAGFKEVYNMEGGFDSWRENGYPVKK